MKRTFLLLSVFFLLAVPESTLGGASSSGGIDNPKKESGSAWFLQDSFDNKEIQYCLKGPSGKFGGEAAVDLALKQAFDTWKEYASRVEYSNIRFIFNLKKLCDGKERLTVYLGGTSPEIERIKLKHENPTAFTERTEYDPDTRLGKGFLWLAEAGSVDPQASYPNWTAPYVLGGVILHEVGHIMGIADHIEGTIMGNLRTLLTSPPNGPSKFWLKQQEYYLTHIDHEQQLILCAGFNERCAPEEYRLRGKGVFWATAARFEKAFERVMNRKAEGEVTGRMTFEHQSGPHFKKIPLVTLYIGDEKTPEPLTLPITIGDTECFPTGAIVFKREMTGHTNLGIQNAACRTYGTLVTKAGEILNVSLTLNGMNSRVNLDFVDGGKQFPIFRAFDRDKVK